MRVGINARYLGPNKTGVGRYLSNLLQAWTLKPRGHEFYLYVSTEQLDSMDRKIVARSPFTLRRVPRPFKTHSFQLWYLWAMPRALIQDDIDFFFSPDYFLPPIPSSRIRRALTIHDVSYLAHPEWFPLPYRIYSKIFSKRQARQADIIFTVSEYSKQEIIKLVGVPGNRIQVTPEAAEKRYHPAKNPKESINELGIGKRYFLYVGTVFNRRNVDQLITAFNKYLGSSNDRATQLVIRGKNETRPWIDMQGLVSSANRVAGRQAIVILDFINDQQLINLYQDALGFFYLSDYEGFGLPVAEALACGIPTITTQSSSLPEVGGEAAIYIDPRDSEGIRRIMQKLINDKNWTQSLKEKSLRQAQKFSWENTADLTLQAMERTAYEE